MKIIICWALSIISVAPCKGQKTATELLRQALAEQGNPEYRDNEVTLLPSAAEKYADLLQCIDSARHFVHLEYFIFRRDSVGNAFLHLLHKKVNEGVEVRLLIDAYGNYKSPIAMKQEHLDSIRALGIDVQIFDPLHFPWIQNMLHRDHRKIVVVDGKVAFTGGMNIADYYERGTERTGRWRDMQIRLQGPVVNEFESIFAQIWHKTTGEELDSLKYCNKAEAAGDKLVSVVNREPKKLSRKMRKAFVSALDVAQREVRIVNPYPTNTHSVRRAMKRLLRRGVRLQIMVSSSMDNRITPEVVAIEMKRMMRRGAEVYYYEGGFHHTKVMMVDDELCSIGTANFDGRSLRYDYEVNVFVFSPQTTLQLNTIFNADLQNSVLLTPNNFKQRFTLRRRFIGRLFQPIKGLL